MDVLRTDHSAVNGVEWYAQTLNDALQMCCATVRDVTERSVTAMRTICLSSREVDAMDYIGPSYPPASIGHISAIQFGFVQHDYRFT
ncbi:hypothetical protein TNCV_1589431 [Trichonephila clavipes]|uniref:Uncharacterized protein n=1 Tax=Trichonephila clavipes TaxID=2585209 RepID=A0A8X6V3J0_TRICX|nr:hypothetical protein TNCV_1589431 [Trichonephila clavipes]